MRALAIIFLATLMQAQPVADWNALMPAVRELLAAEPGQSGQLYPIEIRQQADLTGDGVPEALVYTGDGGAYTDYLVVLRAVDGKPVLANFKTRKGQVSRMSFARGASVMHSIGVELRPLQQAVFSFNYDLSGDMPQKVVACGGEAYQWNPKTETFEYKERLTRDFLQPYCRQVRAETKASGLRPNSR